MFDPMSELSEGEDAQVSSSGTSDDATPVRPAPSGGGNGKFAQELHSETIHARQRTFYIDLKESGHGKFLKVSEKSRGGQKTTIMFDVEDLDPFINALQEMKKHV